MVFWVTTIGGAFIALASGLLPLNILQTFLRLFFPGMTNEYVEYVRIFFVFSGVMLLFFNAFINRRKNRELITELESTKKVLYKVEQQQQLRELSPEQIQHFRTFLREVPGRFIPTEFPAGDREAERLALQLISVLKSEGWEAGHPHTLVYFNPPIEGIIISVRNLDSAQPHVSILQRAFEAIGMPAKIEVDDTPPRPPIQLLVGHKPLE